ncbi:hypothetical protein [Treponema pedis]|nr:hypothetical protein [Treponema pedis]
MQIALSKNAVEFAFRQTSYIVCGRASKIRTGFKNCLIRFSELL